MTKTQGQQAAFTACLTEYKSAGTRRRWQIASAAYRAGYGLPSYVEREFLASLRSAHWVL